MIFGVHEPTDPRIAVFQGLRDKALRQRRESPGGDMAGVFIAEGDVVIDRAV
ncbi:MAG TPA: rRNA methyltransferase, partial [Candidatus Latescibacteria bacterium]|nr:rRNA methyltransferase [Candidatus Latescibacterota bacterium]